MPTMHTMGALMLGLALAACGSDVTPPPLIDGEFVAVRIYGDVLTAAGTPAVGATVRLEAFDVATCTFPGAVGESVVTDAAGRFAGTIGNWGTSFDVCLRVRAEPPAGASFGADSATRPLVRVGGDWGDSLRVDLTLPPGA
jgi:hypothetical protein